MQRHMLMDKLLQCVRDNESVVSGFESVTEKTTTVMSLLEEHMRACAPTQSFSIGPDAMLHI